MNDFGFEMNRATDRRATSLDNKSSFTDRSKV